VWSPRWDTPAPSREEPAPKLEMAFILGLQLRTVPTLTVAKIVSVSIPWSEAKKNFEWTDVGQGEAYPEPTS
jgi:hypothetical protein